LLYAILLFMGSAAPVPSHSLLFAGNPRRCIFGLFEDGEAVGGGRGDKRASTVRAGVKSDNETQNRSRSGWEDNGLAVDTQRTGREIAERRKMR
jgi:hypothetical protein